MTEMIRMYAHFMSTLIQSLDVILNRLTVSLIIRMGWDFNVGFMPYSDSWRAHRRVLHQWFRPNAVLDYHPFIASRVRGLMKDLLDEPESAFDLLIQYALFYLPYHWSPRYSIDPSHTI